MCFNDDKHEIDPWESEDTDDDDIKDLHWARFCLLDYATKNFRHHLHDEDSCTADMIYGLFPDRINLNCISTGFRSDFLSPFYRRGANRNTYSKHEYISTMQTHLRLQFAISCDLENVFLNLINAEGQSIDLNTKLGGSTMLLQASRIGHEGIVRILLKRSVNVNVAGGNGLTEMMWASGGGHNSVAELLLQAEGVDINSRDNSGRTALPWASRYGHNSVVELLLQGEGVDINPRDNYGQTALSLASEKGHHSVVKLLLQAEGVDINSRNNCGQTALSLASEEGRNSVVKLLL
ncbi:ankyrin repeat-containing domain protein [Pyronema domesticum]|nr:ankyrin repeat-containing domain protein [Pyronema domesticum]